MDGSGKWGCESGKLGMEVYTAGVRVGEGLCALPSILLILRAADCHPYPVNPSLLGEGDSRLKVVFSLPPSFCYAKIHLPHQREAWFGSKRTRACRVKPEESLPPVITASAEVVDRQVG